MARFDAYANPDASERKHTPFFVDVQNEFIDALTTRVVIPLRKESAFGARARNLNPLLIVAGEKVVLDTAAIGAVPLSELRRRVANLRDDRAMVQEALDTLFGAY
ncbi:MAG: CcdB family protein [Burkholderiaceae bacterium]